MENGCAEFFEYIIDKARPYDKYENALDAELARDGLSDERRDALLDRYSMISDKRAGFMLTFMNTLLLAVVFAAPAVTFAYLSIRNTA